MKERLIIVVLTLFLAISISACGKETKSTETDSLKATVEQAKNEELETNSSKITSEPVDDKSTSSNNNSVQDTNISDSTNEKAETEEIENTNENGNSENPMDDDVYSNPVVMSTPPFSYYLSENAPDLESKPLKLEIKLSTSNNITDEAEWFLNNNLTMNLYQLSNLSQNGLESLPEGIDQVWDELIITKAFYDDSYIYCTYGANYSEGYILNIYDKKSLKLISCLDFTNYRYSPEFIVDDYDYIQQKINWATIKDNILYISHSHNTYAKSSNNMNAYITAIDLTDKSIIWRTDTLLCNSYNFILIDDVILCGYGFTDEPDYLYQLDIHNGKVLDKITLKSSPSYILKKVNTIYVRTYNTDYELGIVK